MFDVPPKCPALADKLTGIFGWRHTYRVSQKHKGITHAYLQKSYSLTLPKRTSEFIKEPDSWVAVHHLQTQSGILDPDDRVNDVADDREQILASFEDAGPDPGVQQGGGDGASGSSSVGTGSPDIFRDANNPEARNRNNTDAVTPHIEVTSTTTVPHSGLGLQVRRSSDPNLVQSLKTQSDPTKRWSAAAPNCTTPERILDKIGYLSPQWETEDDDHYQRQNPQQTFARSGRLSMQFLGDGSGYKWMDAADKLATQSYSTKSLPREAGKRKEPLGQAYESIREKNGEMLLIINEGNGRLDLSAEPDEAGGLLVQSVEVGSAAERGRLRKGDRILEINGIKLVGLNDSKMKEHLRRSLEATELRVRVMRGSSIARQKKEAKMAEMIEAEEKAAGTKVATVSPTRKVPGTVGGTSLQVANTRKPGRKLEIPLKKGPHSLGFTLTSRDNPAGGVCPIYIKKILPKGAAIDDGRLKPGDRLLEVDGVSMNGKSHSDVVAMLKAAPPGAIITLVVSRQLELTEANEREINLVKETDDTANRPPKPPTPILPPSLAKPPRLIESPKINLADQHDQNFIDGGSESAASSDSLQNGAWRNREVLTLHIPVNDTKKAGLGVSVKGKTSSGNSSNGSNNSTKNDGDLGIFVKNVLHGGAASRDGRLRMNDQLISINGVSLLGQSNADAMETLRRAMLHSSSKIPGVITLTVARKIGRPHSSGDLMDQQDSSNTSENSGTTVIYLSPDKKEIKNNLNRWSNPVLDRLTGGICSNPGNKRPSPLMTQGLRNESYYIATNDTWSPPTNQLQLNHSVLIEDDPEPMSPTLPPRPSNDPVSPQSQTSSHNCDATYSSQLSLETNTSAEAFSRDAIGRRSISEKHHAALDARETGTYQRNKKIREEREKERRSQLTKSAILSGSVESLTRLTGAGASTRSANHKSRRNDFNSEAMDKVGDLGPSLGLKKSSSLESLQTMVQEIQMSDEPRGGPSALRAPRGRGREENLRAAVVGGPEGGKPRKHWLLEEAEPDAGFANRNSPFQSSLNDGKNKNRGKKPGLLKGIGHMFRFGKHRKDGIMPIETVSEFGVTLPPTVYNHYHHQPQQSTSSQSSQLYTTPERPKHGPPTYQPPPPPATNSNNLNGGIQHNDIFNHRYQHYVNYEEIQQQQHQISRRHQHYHSQRSARNEPISNSQHYYQHHSHHQQQSQNQQQSHHSQGNTRPSSNFYEYEMIKHNVSGGSSGGASSGGGPSNDIRKAHGPSPPRQWKSATINGIGSMNGGGSGRSRGPFITHVQIRDQTQAKGQSQPQQLNNAQQQTSQHHNYYQHQSSQQPHASRV